MSTDPAALLERDAELASLQRHLLALRRDGASGCVALRGEAGLGKTSLLQAARRSSPAGLRWLWGTCEPLQHPPPLGPLLDMLDALPPSLAAAVQAGQHGGGLLSAMQAALADARRPAVLVVDDAQWADAATLDLLRYLGRRVDSLAAVLVIAWRDGETPDDHPLHAVLAGLPPPRTLQLVLPPLSAEAVARLAQQAGRRPDGLHALTGGNPFHLHALLALDDPTGPLPASLRDALLARCRVLDAQARRLLVLVSLMPGPTEPVLLDHLLPGAAAAVPACLASQLLVSDADGLRLRHALTQRVLADTLPADEARRVHLAAWQWLQARHAAATRQLHHALGAGLDASRLLPLAQDAASEAAEAGDHRQAVAWCQLALLQAGAADAAVQAGLHQALAAACLQTNQPGPALQALQQAAALRQQAGDRAGLGQVLRHQAQVLWLMQRRDAAKQCAHQALPLLREADDHAGLAQAHATLAQVHLHDDDLQPAEVWGGHAARAAERLGLHPILVDALNTLACARLRSDDDPAAWQQLRRSLQLARQHAMPDAAARAHANLAGLSLVHGHLDDALQWCADGIAWCDAHGLDLYALRLRLRRGHVWLARGDWALVDDELAHLRRSGPLNPIESEQADYLADLLALRRGDPSMATRRRWLALMAGARRLAVQTWYSPLALAQVEAAWLLATPAEALALARRALPQAHDLPLRGQLLCWLQRLGEPVPPGAAAMLATPDPAADPSPAGACAAELAGRHADAAALWQALGLPWQQALALLHGGEADQRRALPLLAHLGADGLAARARRLLRAQGVRHLRRGPYRVARQDPWGLTRREREVWEQLALGLSNRDIAELLRRSERTIEHHVGSLLAKLGVPGRHAALQLWVAERKEPPPA